MITSRKVFAQCEECNTKFFTKRPNSIKLACPICKSNLVRTNPYKAHSHSL